MSRVFEVPRYKDQTKNKVILLLAYGDYYERLKNRNHELDKELNKMRVYHRLGINGSDMHDLNECDYVDVDGKIAKKNDDKNMYAFRAAVYNNVPPSALCSAGKAIGSIFKECNNVYYDYEAMHKLLFEFLSLGVIANLESDVRRNLDKSHVRAIDFLVASVFVSKCNPARTASRINRIVKWDDQCLYAKNAHAATYFLNKVHTASSSPNVKMTHDAIMNGEYIIDPEMYRDTKKYFDLCCNNVFMYKVLGLKILIVNRNAYVLDHSSSEQIFLCMKFWSGVFDYAYNFRITGDDNKHNVVRAVITILEWMIKQGCDEKLARHMKSCYALFMNNVHMHAENKALGAADRENGLWNEISGYSVRFGNFYDVMKNLSVNDRIKIDLGYMYYGLPCPDCDPNLLFETTVKKMSNSNNVDDEVFNRFMKYSKAFDLCHALVKYGDDVVKSIKCDDEYDFANKHWFKKCVKGELSLPPDAEMGKAWIENYFPFENHMNYWYWEASDVTRVIAHNNVYESMDAHDETDGYEHNELLYALKHAPYLDRNKTPDDVRDSVICGSRKWDPVCVIAAKSENTKFGAKIRETYSGSDCLREVTSEVDRTGIKAAALGNAAALRMNPVAFSKNIGNINDMCTKVKSKRVVIMSLDVQGWSSNANRSKVLEHHDYVAKISGVNENYKLSKVWDDIVLFIKKRESFASKEMNTGMFQGFTGTLDTTLHQHLLYFAIREGKRAGIFRNDETAYGLCLIDDGVIALQLSDTRDSNSIDQVCNAFVEQVKKVYKSIGFIIDPVKTICSNIKFTFLNRIFMHGTEVMTPMKIFAKIDRDYNRKFCSLYDQIQTVFGAGYSAISRGSDPMFTYYYCIRRSFELMFWTSREVSRFSADELFVACIAPPNHGGFGFPTFVSWTTGEIKDKLSHFIHCISYFIRSVKDQDVKQRLASLLHEFCESDFDDVVREGSFTTPRNIRYKNIKSPSVAIVSAVADAVSSFSTSNVFLNALKCKSSERYVKALTKVMKNVTVDCSILEEVMSISPMATVAAIYDKATKNQMLNILLTHKKKVNLLNLLRKEEKGFIHQVVERCKKREVYPDYTYFVHNSPITYANNLRQRYYDSIGFKIVNHTLPDPIHMLTLTNNEQSHTISVNFKNIHSPISDEGCENMYSNMYDGFNDGSRYNGARTKGIIDTGRGNFRSINKIAQAVVKGAALSAYAQTRNGEGSNLWSFIKSIWGCYESNKVFSFDHNIGSDVSAKRMGRSVTSRNHNVGFYPNVVGSVEINAINLGRWLDNTSTHVDYMSVITCLRSILLYDYGFLMNDKEPAYFNIKTGATISSNSTIFKVRNDNEFKEGLANVSKEVGNTARDVFEPTMNDFENKEAKEEEIFGIKFYDEEQGVIPHGGMLAALGISSGSYVKSVSIPKKGNSNADEKKSKYDMKPSSLYRKYCEKMNQGSAFVSTVCQVCYRHGVKVVPSEVYSISWNRAEEVYDKVYKGVSFEMLYATMKNIDSEATALFPSEIFINFSKSFKRALAGHAFPVKKEDRQDYIEENQRLKKRALVAYYMMAHGRMPTTDAYNAISANSRKEIIKCWRFASRRNAILERVARAKGDKDEQTRRHFLIPIYSIAPDFAQKGSSIIDFALSVSIALCDAAIEKYTARITTHNVKYPTIDSIKLHMSHNKKRDEDIIEGYKKILRDCNIITSDISKFVKELSHVHQDVLVMGSGMIRSKGFTITEPVAERDESVSLIGTALGNSIMTLFDTKTPIDLGFGSTHTSRNVADWEMEAMACYLRGELNSVACLYQTNTTMGVNFDEIREMNDEEFYDLLNEVRESAFEDNVDESVIPHN